MFPNIKLVGIPLLVLTLVGCDRQPESANAPAAQSAFALNDLDYFQNRGVGVMAFHDDHPESRQGGVIMVMHGNRIATNGDLRLEPTPGQWSPVPKLENRVVDREAGEIRTTLSYPDERQNLVGFNPLYYPDLELTYDVVVSTEGDAIKVRVDLDRPIPDEWVGEIGFNLELYPADLFGMSWIMDDQSGIFPRQAYGVTVPEGSEPNPQIVQTSPLKGLVPLDNHRARPAPLATGRTLSVAPESDEMRLQIETRDGHLELLDGRVQHQNGWFVVRTTIPGGVSENALEWTIRPNVIHDWIYQPVIQHSMVGYHPQQSKVAVIETDPNDNFDQPMQLIRLTPSGEHQVVLDKKPQAWGDFLRYRYFHFDFSDVKQEGMYQLVLGNQRSKPFRIADNVYDQNVWQPTLEYFLPIQMGHMRVKEKYKLWHDASHLDDALMAQVDINHFDGYVQGPDTLTDFAPGEHVPGLNRGGWYDAGDEDFRIESQSGEVFILSAAYEEFDVQHDNTLIDQTLRLVEIREPDGVPDILQQIEHGLLTVVGGYQALGRLYRGIIVPTLTQYVMGGDFSGQTDNLIYDPELEPHERTATHSGLPDDRWVFTENNPGREFDAIANIAASVGPMRDYDEELANDALTAATELWQVERPVENDGVRRNKVRAAVELFRATGADEYRDFILSERDFIIDEFRSVGWAVARAVHQLNDEALTQAMRQSAAEFYRDIEASMADTPYGLTFEMQLWGRGWDLQRQGVAHYFLHQAFPEEFGKEYLLNILHYVLGTNPGSNNQSYASGVGAKSKIAAYGINRMDYSYVPGGVIVGTALIAPDFPELKEFPYLWQQSEYVLGGGASRFMFLALAADKLLNE
ncbi:glycoside hydrolase family 9 protein [Marinimicrobium sp. ABcell2]|uniref:glycoside hydrolase family 9 protein n=1 Tax=Marinimicrobium sp. ABcell2 TaxID=3069751 RepID=UPI0027B5DD83|nr:glycoside hydrolase family 9 protein [Marinimicrobium sp. ABcell2]MDQ2076994.1 glycoside hydrolase family 9 protein [Marinimicrobium sp. ABcell2]